MSRGVPMRWAEEAEADEKLFRSLPRRPGERAARDAEVSGVGALRFSSAFEKTLQSAGKSGGRGGGGGGGGKQRAQQSWGQDMTQVFCCAACRVDSSGEVSFAQHCLGKSHRKAAGQSGFVGLVPNAAGIEPRVSDALIAACAGAANAAGPKKSQKGGKAAPQAAAKGGSKGEPGVVSVGLSAVAHANMRSALLRSASETELAATSARDAAPAAPGVGKYRPPHTQQQQMHKSVSLPQFGNAPPPPSDGFPPPRGGRLGVRPLPAPLGGLPPTPPPDAQQARVEVFRRAGGGGSGAPPPRDSFFSGGGGGHGRNEPREPPSAPPPNTSARESPDWASMQAQRAALPAAAYAGEICSLLARNQVLVVVGETGCGKTTQVPQFLLDAATASGQPCNMICTQPRRISAIGVAERVAAERCERIGGTIGYSIRLESASSAATRLLFCTTGILLRRLEDDPSLASVSHVFVDEVHERSLESDFLLMVLRGLLSRRTDLRLVLMSATINATLFADYFGAGTPVINIPGRTFPVTALYLEDALELTGHRVRASADWARKGGGKGRSSEYGGGSSLGGGICHDFTQGRCDRGDRCRFSHGAADAKPLAPPPPSAFAIGTMRGGGGGGGGTGGGASLASRRLGGNPGSVATSDAPDDSLTEAELAERYPRYGAGTVKALAALDHSQIDFELLQELVGWIMSQGAVETAQMAVGGALTTGSGAADDAWDAEPPPRAKGSAGGKSSGGGNGNGDCILVFLPGLKEITAAFEQLTGGGPLACEPQRSWVLPLHGSLTSEEQRRIFQRPPPGVRKVVLATNIAETSITIDDCGFVIDCGRMKETRYDPARRMESLEDVPVSRANAQQRRGRAGRVMSGVAFHLVTRHTFEQRLDAAQAPEMHRVPLEQLVLRIKVLRYPGSAAQVVSRCLEPPAPEAVSRAVSELVRLEALSGAEELTPLGTHLAKLPVDVRIGKLILLGAIFNVVDDVLTIAATLSYRSPFLSPFERRAEADASKRAFAVGQSDHLTALNAYREFDRGGARRFEMCRERFLGVKTLMQIASIKRQLLELLSDARFVRPGLRSRTVEAIGRRADGSDGVRVALQDGAAGMSSDACFRCGQRGHAARECSQPERRTLYSAADAWQDGVVNGPLIKALLTAALYPQVMCVTYPQKKTGKAVKPESLKFHIREDDGAVVEVAMHPSSVNSKESAFDSQYLVYHEKVRTTRIYVRDCSTVSPFALILFGGALGAERSRKGTQGDALLTVDSWIKFSVPRHAVDLLLEVRAELDGVLRRKIEFPDADVSGAGRHMLDAVASLLGSEGAGGR